MTWRRVLLAVAAAAAGYLLGVVLVPGVLELHRHVLEHPRDGGHLAGMVLAGAGALLVLAGARR